MPTQTHVSIRRMRLSERRGPEAAAIARRDLAELPAKRAGGDRLDGREHQPLLGSPCAASTPGARLAAEAADELAVGAHQLVALGLQVAALAVQPQHRHLQRDDADEHGRAGHDQQRRGHADARRRPPRGRARVALRGAATALMPSPPAARRAGAPRPRADWPRPHRRSGARPCWSRAGTPACGRSRRPAGRAGRCSPWRPSRSAA